MLFRTLLLMLAPLSLLFASDDGLTKAAALIKAEHIRAGVAYLASDALEGRGTGTAGEKKAAAWIADQYKASGLVPMGGDSFFQKVDLIGYQKDPAASSLTLTGPDGAVAYQNEETLTYWSTSQKEVVEIKDAPLVFVGYGVEAPEYGWDDYKGLDCKGKILVFLNNDPQTGDASMFGGEARTYYGRWPYKFEQAMAKGAAGAIIIHTTPSAGYGWSVVHKSGLREGFAIPVPGTGYQLDFVSWIHQDLAETLAGMVDSSLTRWFEAANRKDFKPVPLPVKLSTSMKVAVRKTQSQNVVGVWEGSDPKLKHEYVVFTAHYDHLGKLEEGEGDLIHNGAWDNALGTASIVEIAAAFGKSGLRARRSIAFVACAAEEKGSLGSRWFVAKPPVPLRQITANINIDMPQAFGLTRDIVAVGYDVSTLGDTLVAIANEVSVDGKQGVPVKGDPNPNAGIFYRSDQVNFAKAGIPALFALPGGDYVKPLSFSPEDYEKQYYHQPGDEIRPEWELSGCVRDMRIYMELAWRMGNAAEIARWRAGNEFEDAWKKLHGGKR